MYPLLLYKIAALLNLQDLQRLREAVREVQELNPGNLENRMRTLESQMNLLHSLMAGTAGLASYYGPLVAGGFTGVKAGELIGRLLASRRSPLLRRIAPAAPFVLGIGGVLGGHQLGAILAPAVIERIYRRLREGIPVRGD